MYSLINLDLQIFIKSNDIYSSLFRINVRIFRSSRRTWLLLLTLKYKDNRLWEPLLLSHPTVQERPCIRLVPVHTLQVQLQNVWSYLLVRSRRTQLHRLSSRHHTHCSSSRSPTRPNIAAALV
jgi:hypothetical protein